MTGPPCCFLQLANTYSQIALAYFSLIYLQSEFSHPYSSLQNKNTEALFKELDVNSDNAINFEEFLVLVIRMGVAAHKDSHRE